MNYFEKNIRWKDFFISFLLLLAMVVVTFSFIGVSEGATINDMNNKGTISKNLKVKSSAASNVIIDNKSVLPIKKSKSNKNLKLIHWKSYSSSKSVTVFSRYSQGKYKSTIKKTIIKKIAKNKLKISSQGTVRYVRTKHGPKSYYLNIYKPKMLNNTIKKGVFDEGFGYIHIPDEYLDYELRPNNPFKSSWKAEINGNRIIINEFCEDSNIIKNTKFRKGSIFRTIIIEKIGNGLDFKINSHYIFCEREGISHPAVVASVSYYYIEKNLLPLEYYLNVYKKIITKNSLNNFKPTIPSDKYRVAG